jgi:hypothetical protein
MNGYYSTWNSINAGVPQGSILGPLLFLLFINDIVDVVCNSMKLFADDTSLYCIVDHQNETAASQNSDLNSLSTWAADWCVNFNASKTKPMQFTRKHDVTRLCFIRRKILRREQAFYMMFPGTIRSKMYAKMFMFKYIFKDIIIHI